MKARDFMEHNSIASLLWKFSLPATIGMLVNAFYNIIDRIFVGNSADLGPNGLAGITITFPIVMLLMAVALMCGVGGSTVFSISLGEKKYEYAKKVIGNAFGLAIFSAFLLIVFISIFMKDILLLFGASKIILPYAQEYLRIVLFGAIFQAINMTGNNLIRADGNPKIAMLTIILGAGVNILLDPIFIYLFRWGMSGAALATIIGQFCSTLWVLYYFTKGKASYKLSLSLMKLDFKLAKRIIATGLPAFAIQAAGSIVNIFLNYTLVKHGGDLAVSARGIIDSVQTLMLMPVIGVNQGALPIIGYNFGAKRIDRVKETIKLSIIVVTTICLVGWISIIFFASSIVSVFTNDQQLISLGSQMLRIWFLLLPIIGLGMVGSNYFQSIGKVIPAVFLTLLRQIFLLIPLIFILSNIFGLYGIIYAAPISDLISVTITVYLLNKSLKKLSN